MTTLLIAALAALALVAPLPGPARRLVYHARRFGRIWRRGRRLDALVTLAAAEAVDAIEAHQDALARLGVDAVETRWFAARVDTCHARLLRLMNQQR